jgi:hypothetical protein
VRAPAFYQQDNGVMGPNDLLGFRNTHIPNVADVVIIGDSQTYGSKSPLADNWPSAMQELLADKRATFYSMATGGWSAVQYLNMARYAGLFRPKLVIVAFYSGNDPLESFTMAYGVDEFASLRLDPKLSASDAPSVPNAEPRQDLWTVRFGDGVQTVFTPNLRFSSNDPDIPAAMVGWRIMQKTAEIITSQFVKLGIKPVFTIIPTKEWVYAAKAQAEGLQPPEKFRRLVAAETENIARLERAIEKLPGATYADVAHPLRKAALQKVPLYPADSNGHPIAAGYRVIAEAVTHSVDKLLPPRPHGMVAVMTGQTHANIYLVTDEGAWQVPDREILRKNGWNPDEIKMVSYRDIASLPIRGTIDHVDKTRFGPRKSMIK